MNLGKKSFIIPFLCTVYVITICALSLLSIVIYQKSSSFQEYSILPPYKSLAVNTGNLQSESSTSPSSNSESTNLPTDGSETSPSSEENKPQLPPDAPNYMRLYPEMYGPGHQPGSEVSRDMTPYLTFDDGPSKNTNTVLDILDRYGIKATFFVVPNDSQGCMEHLREIHDRGHTIGVHSKSHDYRAIYKDVESYLNDFSAAYEIIYQATGEYPTLFRFPGGSINSYNRETHAEIIQEMERRGFVYFDWNVSAEDAKNGITSDEVYQNVISTLGKKKSGVVLMHDSNPRVTTVEALPRIIETLQERGFQFDRLSNNVHPIIF